jgi:hypothetical protein
MNLVLKFLAAIAGVEPMTAPPADKPAPGPRIVTPDAQQPQAGAAKSVSERSGGSKPKTFTPTWQQTGLLPIPRQAATPNGQTLMRDVSYTHTVGRSSVLGR